MTYLSTSKYTYLNFTLRICTKWKNAYTLGPFSSAVIKSKVSVVLLLRVVAGVTHKYDGSTIQTSTYK